MPAERLVRSASPDPGPPEATATRNEYARRRLSTAAGLHELRQWRRTSAVLAAYSAAVIAALFLGAVAISGNALHTAWVDLIDTRTITVAVVKATFTLAVVLTLPLAGSAVSVVVRLRPWRPHSGRSVLWATPPQRLRTDWPAWRAAAQAHMLTDHAPHPNSAALPLKPRPQPGQLVRLVEPATEPRRRLAQPEPVPESEPEPEPEPDIHLAKPDSEPEPDTDPAEPEPDTHLAKRAAEPPQRLAEPEPEPVPESGPEPAPGLAPGAAALAEPATDADSRLLDAMARVGAEGPWTDDLAGEEWEDPTAPHGNAPSVRGEAESPATAPSPSSGEPESLVFWLFGPNKKVSAERESMLALLVANNRRLHLKDGARILGLAQATLRMRFTRASKEGWTKHSGINYWSLSDRVTTDLEMLITAVADGDEHMASQIAERIGPPLPALRAEWIDNRAGGLTPREELRAAADDALARAAELWPTNRAFADAADRLYGDD